MGAGGLTLNLETKDFSVGPENMLFVLSDAADRQTYRVTGGTGYLEILGRRVPVTTGDLVEVRTSEITVASKTTV